jgi:predicted nucleotidyltransferase
MDKAEDIILIAKRYLDLVKAANFPMQIERAYLFGSYAKGCPNKDSDIDIALVVREWDGGYEDTVVPMWRLRDSIDIRIEPHIVESAYDPADFLPEIERTGIELV